MIDGVSPGPICGWTFIEPFGAFGGEFNFTPGIMSGDSFDADDFPIAAKPLPAPLASVFGISGQWSFTEHTTVPNALTTYQLSLNNTGLTEALSVSFFGDGSAAVQAGDPNSIPFYLGAWTPVAGATHTAHFTIDGAGVPRLWLDGVEIPLVFIANVLSPWTLYPAESIAYGDGAGDIAPSVSHVTDIFVTAGVVGPETVFCCP